MSLDTVFVICAALGGSLFVVQLVLQLLGFAGTTLDVDTDAHIGDGHPSADWSFKVLSTQGLTAFFLMFGLIGLATLRSQAEPSMLQGALAAGAGLIGGGATTWVIAKLFRLASRMQSSGTIDLQRALGATGTVYLTVKSGKPGKVTVAVGGRLLTLDARVAEGDPADLATGTPIVVTRVFPDESVEVKHG